MSDVFFPILSASEAQMATVRCDCLNPKDYPAGRALVLARDEQEIERILADARASESIGAEIARPIWVRFTPQQFTGRSYGLALALADKIARYQTDHQPGGRRLFATGVIAQDGAGRVGQVDGFREKLVAIAEEAQPQDVVILPSANLETADRTVLATLDLLTSKKVKWHSIDHLSAFEAYWTGGDPHRIDDDRGDRSTETTNGHRRLGSATTDAGVATSSRRRPAIKAWHLGAVMIMISVLLLSWPLHVPDGQGEVQHRLVAEQNTGQAPTAFEMACDGGDLPGCTQLGFVYRHGKGVDQDFDRAEAAFIKACEGYDASGCAHLDRLYREEAGSSQDFQRARALFRQVCDRGFAWGCSHYGRLYRDGLGVGRDYGEAGVAFRQACEGGDPPACSHLGILYLDGKGVEQDREQALVLFQRACDGGFPKGCTNLGMLQTES